MSNEIDDLNEIDEIISKAKNTSTNKKSKKNISEIKKNLNVSSAQMQFLNFIKDNNKEDQIEICGSGGVGSGKSYMLCLQLLKYIQEPNTTVLLVHQYFNMLKKTTLRLLLQPTISKDGILMPPLLPPEFIENFNRTEGIIRTHNGSQIILSGCTDEEKLKSLNISCGFIDELSHLSKEAYQSILQRCRVFHKYPTGCFSVTNPASSKSHWIWKHFEENKLPGYRELLTIDSRSNKSNLPASYLRNLENLPELERRRMLCGEWINSGNQVFYTFDKNRHVRYLKNWNKNDYDDYMLCNDLGGGSKFSGTALIGRKDGTYYILEEMSKKKTTHKEVLDFLEKYRNLTELVAYDPANAVFLTDLENAAWTPLKPNKDIEHGVSKLNSLFAEDRIVISSECPTAIKQFEDAFRNPDTNKWDKATAEIDMSDAIRYGILCFDNNALIDKNTNSNDVFVFSL